MSDTYEVTVKIKKNGKPLPGFPITRAISVDEDSDMSSDEVTTLLPVAYTGGAYVGTAKLAFIDHIENDTAATPLLNITPASGVITIQPGGFALVWNASMDNASSPGAFSSQPATALTTSKIRAIVAGT